MKFSFTESKSFSPDFVPFKLFRFDYFAADVYSGFCIVKAEEASVFEVPASSHKLANKIAMCKPLLSPTVY